MGLILVDNTWEAYRKVQKNNTRRYNNLTKLQQKQLREKGYKNSGKANVKKSYDILNKYYPEVQEQECYYYVAVTDKDNNEVQYAEHDSMGLLFWSKGLVHPLRLYESAERLANYVKQEYPSFQVEIQSAPR